MPASLQQFGDNPLVFEGSASNSEPSCGIPEDWPIPLNVLRTSANLTLTAATTPLITALGTNMRVIDWIFSAGAGNYLTYETAVPGQYAQDRYSLKLLLRGAKYDADQADENTDLKFRCVMYWFNSINTGMQNITVDSAVISAATIPADLTDITQFDWQTYTIDIGAALEAAGKQLKAGDSVSFHIGPNETVGATNMHLVMMDARIRWRRHASLYSRADRGI